MTLDLAQIITVGGPTSVISVLVYVLVNAYLSARKDRREQQAANNSNDQGYLGNVKIVLEMARGETDRLEKSLAIEREARTEAEQSVRDLLNENADKDREIERLQGELQRYRYPR